MLARLFRVCGLDCDRESAAMPSVISVTSCDSLGGVDGGVSESLVCSDSVPKCSPLLRGLGSTLCSGIMWVDMLESGAAEILGSQGIGLFGSLESQFGMLLCL